MKAGDGSGVAATTVVEMVEDRAADVGGDLVGAQDPRPEIEGALGGIEDERLRLVLVRRYGLDGDEP